MEGVEEEEEGVGLAGEVGTWLGLLMTKLPRLLGRGKMQIRGREPTTIAEIRGQERWRGEDFQAEAFKGYSFQILFTCNVTKHYPFVREKVQHRGPRARNRADHTQLTSTNYVQE